MANWIRLHDVELNLRDADGAETKAATGNTIMLPWDKYCDIYHALCDAQNNLPDGTDAWQIVSAALKGLPAADGG